MRVRLLGQFEVEGRAERDLGSRKGRTLLKLLALARGAPVSVDRIAEVLWGDTQPARAADQVGVLVSRLRRAVGPERLSRTQGGYALTVDWLDIEEFDRLAERASEALAGGLLGVARVAADAALALVRGPLLDDEDGEWVEADRASVDAAIVRVRRIAVDAAVTAGDYDSAAALAEQALAHDPYDEVVLRALMQAHLDARRPASALAAYARVRERLAEELGVPPTAETEALHAEALAAADGDTVSVSPLRRDGISGVVGRSAELDRLDSVLDQAGSSGSVLVVVEGDAGIGKTTVIDGWTRRIEGDALVLRGRCDPLGRDLPLQPVADALADHLRVVGTERAAAIVAEDSDTLVPLLGPITGGTATLVADADAARVRVFAALVAVLGRAGQGRPVVLVVEDLHLAGTGTLEWLAFARRRAQGMTVVVTTRPRFEHGLDATRHITLGPLDRQAVTELVGADRADELFERSGGHPLLLAALASSPDEALPSTLREAVARRVDSLGDAVAKTVRLAAVLGPECDLELVAQVAATPVVEVLGHLEAATRAGLVVEQGSRFGFRHELFREAIEMSTGAARRALVHQLAAHVLASRPQPDPLAVAVHARAGGDRPLAASWFVIAGAAATTRFDLAAAEEHLGEAIALDESCDAYVARSRLRMSRLDYDAAAGDAERAISLGGGAVALEVAGWVAYYQRRYDEARAYADGATARATDDGVRISALALAGRIRHGAGDLTGAVECLAALTNGPVGVQGIADVWLAQARLHQGRPLDALDALARPMVDPDGLAHPWAPLHLRFNRVIALGQLGRVADALRVAQDLDAAVGRSGPVGARFAGPAANVRAWILRWSGSSEEADDHNRRAVELTGGEAGPSADAMAEGHWVALLDLADGCLLRGDLAGAAELAARLAPVDSWAGTMAWHQRHRLGLLRARLALADGDRATAVALATSVADDASRRGAGRYELLARAVLGLADASMASNQLDPVIEGLGRCAALDGWPIVAALGTARRSDAWRATADRRAAAIVAAAGNQADPARRFVSRVLEG